MNIIKVFPRKQFFLYLIIKKERKKKRNDKNDISIF